MSIWIRFEREAKGNSEMTYSLTRLSPAVLALVDIK